MWFRRSLSPRGAYDQLFPLSVMENEHGELRRRGT